MRRRRVLGEVNAGVRHAIKRRRLSKKLPPQPPLSLPPPPPPPPPPEDPFSESEEDRPGTVGRSLIDKLLRQWSDSEESLPPPPSSPPAPAPAPVPLGAWPAEAFAAGKERSDERRRRNRVLDSDPDQLVIDAGQSRFGCEECRECGLVYQPGEPEDEALHREHHAHRRALRFPGWKGERVCGRWGEGRAVAVHPSDPSARRRRVDELLREVVGPELGGCEDGPRHPEARTYLYVEECRIVGCLVAEPLKEAHRLVEDGGLDCRGGETYPVKCGVSRIWTHASHRRRGVATRLMNAMRANFLYGHVLSCEEIALSAPTPQGVAFFSGYSGTRNFHVFAC